MLAETGAVGFLLFLALIATSALGLKIGWLREQQDSISATHYTWLTAFAIMLIGGMTGDDHVHKLLWLIFGIGAAHFSPLLRSRTI
jgi:TctA family transporter